jgi:RHS repeat-associated protein
MLSRTTTYPIVTTAQNGPNTADVSTAFFDVDERLGWLKDEDGFIHYTRFQTLHGVVDRTIVDVNTALTGDFANLPSGWSTPSGGGLHLKTDYRIDNLCRANKVTFPNGNITHTVYLDSSWETRVYPGWTGTAPTGPTIISRRDKLNNYSEILTSNKAPALSGSDPTGAEIIDTASLQTLSREFYDNGDRVIKTVIYHDFTGLSYSGAPNIGTVNTHFYQTDYGYDEFGILDRVVNPLLTITRAVHDGLGRELSIWVGLDDTPTSGEWSPSNTAGTDLVKVTEKQYDNNGVGNNNLTKLTTFVNATATDNRVTEHYYDWQNRRVATKSGVQGTEDLITHRPITYCDLDNLDRCTSYSLYDGDQITITFSAGVPQKPTSSRRRAQQDILYDEEGKVYIAKNFSVNQSSGALSSSAMTTNTFCDRRGNPIKASFSGGLVSKSVFDGAGRAKTRYVSDGGGDTGWADADDVTGDTVLEQSEITFDSNGHVIQIIHKARFHDEVATGSLNSPATAPKCRRSYTTAYFDIADRLTAQVDVGTNAGAAYTRPGSVPARSNTVLVTSYAYTSAGFVDTVTDPRGQILKSFYDMMGRGKRRVEAYVNDVPSGSDDRTTVYTFNGLSQVLTIKADMPSGTNDQTTQYVYGVTTAGGSDLNSNDLLQKIQYPDKTTGNPSTLSSDQFIFTCNAVGQTKTLTDCNQSVRTFTYDVLGREISEAVTTVGSGVDGTIRRLEVAFDTGGRAYLFTSYDAPTAGTVVNQVKRVFNGLYQLTIEYQSISGAVVDATTPKVQYLYTEMAGGANHSRPTQMIYPNGRIVRFEYNSGLDTNISRLSYLADDASGAVGTHLEEYSYLGPRAAIARSHPQTGRHLSYVKLAAEATGDAGDQYTGLDRFGRIVDQRWRDSGGTTHTDRFQYRYDRVGNRMYKRNMLTSNKSELYHANGAVRNVAYDPLERMTTYRRGTLSASGNNGAGELDTVTTTADPDTADPLFATQTWTLDHLGNWSSVVNDGTTQTRTHNAQNQLTTGTGFAFSPTYDNNGNMTRDHTGVQFTYDAWNRQKQIKNSSGTLLKTHSYNALNRRTIEERTATGGGIEYRTLYYSADWQVVEERVSSTPGTEGPARVQFVWSTRYIDEMVLRDRDADSNGSLEERLYVIQDANFNVTSTINTSATVQERMLYDVNGSVKFFDLNFANASAAGTKAWVYLHQGGRYDLNSLAFHFRNREHQPYLGRWMQRDPMGYHDGLSLYSYLGCAAPASTDSMGLQDEKPKPKVKEKPVDPGLKWADCPHKECCCAIVVLQYDPGSDAGKGTPRTAGNEDFMGSAKALQAKEVFKAHCPISEIITIMDVTGGEGFGFGRLQEKLTKFRTEKCPNGIKHVFILGHGESGKGILWPWSQTSEEGATPDSGHNAFNDRRLKATGGTKKHPSFDRAINEGTGGHLVQLDLETCHSSESLDAIAGGLPNVRIGHHSGVVDFMWYDKENKNVKVNIPPTPEDPAKNPRQYKEPEKK